MLDFDLAKLYEVPTMRLNEQVKRNLKIFPSDFTFRLTDQEFNSLISQIAISKEGRGGRRKMLTAFTEQGIAMLSANRSKLVLIRTLTMNLTRQASRSRRRLFTFFPLHFLESWQLTITPVSNP